MLGFDKKCNGWCLTCRRVAARLFLLLLLYPLADAHAVPAGRIVNYTGNVHIITPPDPMDTAVKIGRELAAGEIIVTGVNGWAAILMADETLIQLNRNTRFQLKAVAATAGWYDKRKILPTAAADPGPSVYRLDAGEMWLRNKNRAVHINIETPTISAGIRGTEVNTAVAEDRSVTLSVIEGIIEARNPLGRVTAGAGEVVFAARGMAPEKRLLVSPENAVQWTLSIPPLDDRYAYPLVSDRRSVLLAEEEKLSSQLKTAPEDSVLLLSLARVKRDLNRPDEALGLFEKTLRYLPDSQAAYTGIGWLALDRGDDSAALTSFARVSKPDTMTLLGRAVAFTRQGRFDRADAVLLEGRAAFPDFPPFMLQQAELGFARRDLTGARRILAELTASRPDYGPAWTLSAILHLAQNDTAGALEAAGRGEQAAPESPVARWVMSQAYLAAFDFDSAMAAIDTAVTLDPNHVSAMVHRAKLLFASDRIRAAEKVLAEASRIAPAHAEVLNLQGFVRLAQRKIQDAADGFTRAIQTDAAMAEPHLGLALVHMRKGQDAEALKEITTAVLLAPHRSLFVSYWAKMLYQQRRFKRALEALDYAAHLDPLDPTPHLYRSIILRDLNRPSEALTALNRAIALNDNRAVYRSRFLLDRDLAVKNVDQTIIFQELGLTDWAKSKALASVKTDYLNSAGHTFLAGALLTMDDRLRSGTSEHYLGLLLQKANLNSLNTFEDYTGFFEAPSINGTLTGMVGNHRSAMGSLVAYGAVPDANIAFNSTASYAETDGWRDSNGARNKGAALLLKWDPTPEDGLVLIGKHYSATARDRMNDPYEDDAPAAPFDRNESRSNRITLGYHHHFSPETDFLFLAEHYNGTYDFLTNILEAYGYIDDVWVFSEIVEQMKIPMNQLQGHLLHRMGAHQFILGTLQNWRERDLDRKTVDSFYFLMDGWLYDLGSEESFLRNFLSEDFQSYYVQDIWRISSGLTLEAALYYDVLNYTNLYTDVDQHLEGVYPRLGLIYMPDARNTFRLAAFQYILPFTVARLDPTDIAGIPLYRNALEGTQTTEYDLSWEYEWDVGFVSATLFYMETEQKENYADDSHIRLNWLIRGGELAWNRLFQKGLGMSARYRYLDVSDDFFPDKARRDHLASVALNYLHPRGVFAGVAQSYRREDFKSDARRDEEIWLTDLGAGYKFPGKRGVFRVDIKNIFDHRFNWVVDTMVFNGRVPRREIQATLSLYF